MPKTDIFQDMADRWPSNVVAQSKVSTLTGGVLSGKTLANMKSKGEDVPESVLIGSRRAYVVDSLVDWLRDRTQTGGVHHG
ncbi:MAG: hypothetical protein JXR59_11735 [Desulfuromonadaceae bacterium]|nr:hypothetical protein [Desulfuromonadaceae bacterium]